MTRASAILITVVLVSACGGRDRASRPSPAAVAPQTRSDEPESAGWDLSKVRNLSRIGELTARQRTLLERQGFFLADQPPPSADTAAEARTSRRATHLFHVYERNDYIAMSSYVTADLAIDATLAYFEAVLRDVETHFLVPRLAEALKELVSAAERARRSARSAEAREQATRAVAFWGVALRLLEQGASGDPSETYVPEPPCGREDCPDMWEAVESAGPPPPDPTRLPRAVEGQVARVVRPAIAHAGEGSNPITRGRMDFSQFRPRGNYTRTGVLSRYFRAMSWLGMAAFMLEGEHADVEGLALLARSYLAAPDAARTLEGVIAVTAFFAGGPDASTLRKAADELAAVRADAAAATPDALLSSDVIDAYRARMLALPAPRVAESGASAGRQIRVAGRRAFEDTVALQRLAEPLNRMLAESRSAAKAVPLVGGAGSAAIMGSDVANEILTGALPDAHRRPIAAALGAARRDVDALPAERFGADAYHGTLHAMRALLSGPPDGAPPLLSTDAWKRRALFAYAGGWAKLRHATILYGAQLGAECDAPEPEPPPGWVEPLPELYERLGAMARALAAKLGEAGIDMAAQPNPDDYFYRPLSDKTETLLRFLDFLRDTSRAELEGRPLDREALERITLIGGEVEWLLISLANTDLLSQRDQDMAIVADVFTFRTAQRAVEVGLARPDMIYAIVPTADGPVVARGAVMSYREFLHPTSERMTDEEWRARLDRGEVPPRPDWVDPIYAEPVRAIRLAEDEEGVDRCGPMTGALMEI